MAGPKYIATNLLSSATVTAPGGTATGSAVANLFARRPSKTWTSSVTTANQRVNVDHGSAVDIDTCVIHNHNFPSGASVIVEGHSVAPPASGAWAGATNLGAFTIRSPDMWLALASLSVRYRSVYLENDGGADWSTGGAPKIGELVMNDVVQLTRSFRWGYRLNMNANQISHRTKNGHLWLARRTPRTSDFSLSWQTLNLSQLGELITFHGATADAAVPCSVIPYPDVVTLASSVYYVDVSPLLGITDIHTANKHASLSLNELPREVVLT